MKLNYGELFNLIVKLNPKTLRVQEKQNLHSVIDMLANEIYNNVIKDMQN